MSEMGQNENPPVSGLCQLPPATDIQSHGEGCIKARRKNVAQMTLRPRAIRCSEPKRTSLFRQNRLISVMHGHRGGARHPRARGGPRRCTEKTQCEPASDTAPRDRCSEGPGRVMKMPHPAVLHRAGSRSLARPQAGAFPSPPDCPSATRTFSSAVLLAAELAPPRCS
jgi:hypothetical protein